MVTVFIREKIARQNVNHFAGAIRKTVGLSYLKQRQG